MASMHPMAGQIRVEAVAQVIGRNTVKVPLVRLEGPLDMGKRLVADSATLPGNLARLVPPRWGNAKPEDWAPFVRLAIAMGKL